MSKITLNELFNLNIIQQIQDTFSSSTGMGAVITDIDGRFVTELSGIKDFCNCVRCSEEGMERCCECNREAAKKTVKYCKPHVYKCHMGLYNFSAPIMVNDEVIGCIIGGQVMCENFDDDILRIFSGEINVEYDELIRTAHNMQLEDISKVNSGAQCLYVLANALSAMSYCNYQSMQKIEESERSASLRSGFMTQNLLSELKVQMTNWMYNAKEVFKNFDGNDIEDTRRQLVSEAEKVYYSLVKSADKRKDDVNYNSKFFERVYNIDDITEYRSAEAAELCGQKGIKFSCEISENVSRHFFGDCDNIGYVIDVILSDMISNMDKGEIKFHLTSEKIAYSEVLIFNLSAEELQYDNERMNEIHNFFSGIFLNQDGIKSSHRADYSYIGFILRNMHGNAEVNYDNEKGTAFTVRIPQLEVKEH